MHKFNQDSRLRGNDGELTRSCFVLGFAKISGCLNAGAILGSLKWFCAPLRLACKPCSCFILDGIGWIFKAG
ncbi:MAG: hypothetical protein D8B42_00225 [Kingella sp. (in: b-proteobacteria)]|nr:MAG: hypothetical protein D8B42_00225 [Kingella sp. (in: b-proteobacteria)]